jgi:hypothetical protein
MLDRAERLCCECIAALEKGGDAAAEVTALACLALREWNGVMDCVADAFGDSSGGRNCVIYRFAPSLADLARIETALERFPPGRDHWLRARATLARKTQATTQGRLELADPAIHGWEATPCDQVLRALCEALRWAFRHDGPTLLPLPASRCERLEQRAAQGDGL